MSRNQWLRGSKLGPVLTVFVGVMLLAFSAVGGLAGALVGALVLGDVQPMVLTLVWDSLAMVFLLLWTVGLMTELQRSEIIDLSRLMHLPVSLRSAFLLNYLASHFCFSLAVMVPPMLGLVVGLIWSRGFSMVLLLPLVAGFFFMVTAWTYRLRGWLAGLMMNPRRRRAIIMGMTLLFVLLAQLPNLVVNVGIQGHESALKDPVKLAQIKHVGRLLHNGVPLLWLPNGARTLAVNQFWPALACAAGSLLVGAWGLHRAYLSTVRLYQGAEDAAPTRARSARRSAADPGSARERLLVERRLSFVPEEACALALANFRGLSRAPEVKMLLAMPVIGLGVIPVLLLARRGSPPPLEFLPLIASGAVVASCLGLVRILFNQFGFDRDGFRALVLLPTRRSQVLLGKNLSLLPIGVGIFVFITILLAIFAHLPAWACLAACLQFVGGFAGLAALGSLLSILVPSRIAPGSLRPTKLKGTTALLQFVINLFIPLAMVPILIPAGVGLLLVRFDWLPAEPVTLGLSALLAVAGVLLYRFTMEPLGALLQRRERDILQVVTQEIE
jgi:hypothetical protein